VSGLDPSNQRPTCRPLRGKAPPILQANLARFDSFREGAIQMHTRRVRPQLRAQPSKTDVAWQIVDGDSVVAAGSSLDRPWQNWWGTFEQILGNFPGRVGRHYTLTVRVNDGTPAYKE
jgi:hypothetical protein